MLIYHFDKERGNRTRTEIEIVIFNRKEYFKISKISKQGENVKKNFCSLLNQQRNKWGAFYLNVSVICVFSKIDYHLFYVFFVMFPNFSWWLDLYLLMLSEEKKYWKTFSVPFVIFYFYFKSAAERSKH